MIHPPSKASYTVRDTRGPLVELVKPASACRTKRKWPGEHDSRRGRIGADVAVGTSILLDVPGSFASKGSFDIADGPSPVDFGIEPSTAGSGCDVFCLHEPSASAHDPAHVVPCHRQRHHHHHHQRRTSASPPKGTQRRSLTPRAPLLLLSPSHARERT